MGDSDWRMVVTFAEEVDAATLAGHVEGRREIAVAGGSLSFSGEGEGLFFYAPSGEAIREVAAVVRSVANRLGLAPTRVSAAEWLPEEARWSDEPGRAATGAEGGVDAISEIVLGYFFNRP